MVHVDVLIFNGTTSTLTHFLVTPLGTIVVVTPITELFNLANYLLDLLLCFTIDIASSPLGRKHPLGFSSCLSDTCYFYYIAAVLSRQEREQSYG